MKLRDRIRQIQRESPVEAIDETASMVLAEIAGLELDDHVRVADVAWLLAVIATAKEPRVHTITVTDALALASRMG